VLGGRQLPFDDLKLKHAVNLMDATDTNGRKDGQQVSSNHRIRIAMLIKAIRGAYILTNATTYPELPSTRHGTTQRRVTVTTTLCVRGAKSSECIWICQSAIRSFCHSVASPKPVNSKKT